MVIFLPESEGNLVCCKVIGKLMDHDLHNLTVRIERILEYHGTFLLYIDLEYFKGWEWHAAWGQNYYGKKYWNQIKIITFVGNQKWEQTINKIARNFKIVNKRYFPFDHHTVAVEWKNK